MWENTNCNEFGPFLHLLVSGDGNAQILIQVEIASWM